MMHTLKKYRASAGIVLLACLSTGAFILVASQVEQQRAHAISVEQTKEFAALDKAVEARLAKQKAAADAKKAAEAKKKKEQEKETTQIKTSSPPVPSATSVAAHRNPASIDVVVNKKHPLQPLSYVPNVSSVSCAGRGSTTISTKATTDFQALCAAAAKAGVPLDTSSSYRSYSTQVGTYNYWVSQSGQAGADTYSARPGYSEHQTGFAIDFRVPGGATLSDFTGSAQQKWLATHAWQYGFIQRYTSANSAETGYTAESWHYRYVGRSIAKAYTTSHASSLESYWGIAGGGYN